MAKRVNTRFLIILTAVVAVAIVGALAAHFLFFKKDPAAQARQGDTLLKEGKPREALDKFKYAIAHRPNDKELLVKIGDAYNMMVVDDTQSLGHARAVWRQVVAADPRYEPALERLLDSYWQQMESSSLDGETYNQVRETARRLADLRPADLGVLAKFHIATVRPWLEGLPSVFKQADVDSSVKALDGLMKRDRANADVPYYAALAKLKFVQEKRKAGGPDDEALADRAIVDAGAIMDAALAEQSGNAAMHLRAYQIYSTLDGVERAQAAVARRKAEQAGQAAPPSEGETPSGAKARKALAAALESAKSIEPSETLFADIYVEAAEFARRDRRPADAEKIYEDLLAKRPDDQNVRIRYATLLTQSGIPAKREKAIALLSSEVSLRGLIGARGYEAASLRAKTLIDLGEARLEQARTADDPKRKQAILALVQSDLEKLTSMVSADAIPVLRLRGRLQQLQGNPIGSIQTFERAINLMQNSSNKDFNLINDLANAYLYAGQTGSAKRLLQEVIDRHEMFVPARLQMAQVLTTENKLDDARAQLQQAEKQLNALQAQAAELKELPAWQQYYQNTALSLLSKSNDPKLNETFARTPEATRQEKLNKARIAHALKKYDEAVRLGSAALAEDPKDVAALDAVVNAHLAAGRRPEALAALDKGIAAGHPDDIAGKLARAREKLVVQIELAGATAEQIYERNKKLIEQEPDSPERALKLADLERGAGRLDDAESILLKVHAAEPGNVTVLTRLFDLAISRKQWDKAKSICDKLVATRGDGANGLLYQFRLASARMDKVEALRIARSVRDQYGEFDLGYVAYGQALQASDRFAEAIEEFKTARTKKPLNFDALRGIVECYYALGQPGEARRVIDEARGLFPDNPHFKNLDLNHELAFGDPANVAAEREEIHRRQPEVRENWIELASAYRRVARSKYDRDPAKRAELLGKARDVLAKALERWKGDPEITQMLASSLGETGDFAGGEKLLTDYATAPERAADHQPMLLLADYYVKGSQFEKAEAASREALKRAEAAVAEAGKRAEAASGETRKRAEGDRQVAIENAVRIRLNIADFLSRSGRHDEALAILDGANPSADDLVKLVFRQRLGVLINSGRRDLAERSLLEALAKPATANDPDLQMTLVAVNFDGGKYEDALERVNQILKSDPENVNVRFFRGQILLRKPRPELAKAVEDLNEVRKRNPGGMGARLLLAEAYRKQGDTPHAIRELQDALRLQPASRDLRIKLMDYLSDAGSGDLGEVLRLAREARSTDQLKDDPEWAYREAGVHARRSEWDEALQAMADAIKLAPRDENLRREQQNIMLLAGRNKEVIALTDAAARDPKAPWWIFLNRGHARHGMNDEAGAVAEFNNALSAAGQNSPLIEQVVKAMVATVGKDEALKQVLSRAGQDLRWKLLAAALYSASRPPDWTNAVQMLDEVQAHFDDLSPAQQAQALRIAGPLYQLARPPQFDKAKRTYERLLQIQPDDLFALNNLANLLIDDALVPQPQAARQYSQKAYDLVRRAQPFPAAIFDTHAWVLVQCGELTEAIEILQKVVRQNAMPEAHYHLGEAFLRKGDTRRALEELRAAAQAIPVAISNGQPVTADLEKKIQATTQKATDLERASKGGEADAR